MGKGENFYMEQSLCVEFVQILSTQQSTKHSLLRTLLLQQQTTVLRNAILCILWYCQGIQLIKLYCPHCSTTAGPSCHVLQTPSMQTDSMKQNEAPHSVTRGKYSSSKNILLLFLSHIFFFHQSQKNIKRLFKLSFLQKTIAVVPVICW